MISAPRLSAVVITFNEERNIDRCLKSLQWVDELIVMDSFSTDRTVELARQFTEHVYQHAYDGDISQRERGFGHATGNWFLYVDADEEISPELRDEIFHVISDPEAADGYYLSRRVQIFHRWIERGGWSPDFTFRLFRKDKYRAEQAEVHGGFTVDGRKETLKGILYHYTYETIEQYLAKMNDYTSLQVSNKLRDNPQQRIGWWKIVFSPVSHFLRKYISQKGYKDGMDGFVLAMLGAIYTLALYAKVWEYRIRQQEGSAELPPITNRELKAIHPI